MPRMSIKEVNDDKTKEQQHQHNNNYFQQRRREGYYLTKSGHTITQRSGLARAMAMATGFDDMESSFPKLNTAAIRTKVSHPCCYSRKAAACQRARGMRSSTTMDGHFTFHDHKSRLHQSHYLICLCFLLLYFAQK